MQILFCLYYLSQISLCQENFHNILHRFEIQTTPQKDIPTSVIGEIVMEKLKELDEVAYVRFASIYREFKDVNTFMSEIKKILEK